MNRRGFFAAIAGTAAGVVVGPELAELLAPKRTIFLPPAGGWMRSRWEPNRIKGCTVFTIEEITREALRIFNEGMSEMNRDYDDDVAFRGDAQWPQPFRPGDLITIEGISTKRPMRYQP